MSIRDLRLLEDKTRFEADICIIGAGPAGLTVALQFAHTPTRVCIIESGGFEEDSDTEDLSKFESVGLFRTAPEMVRRRGWGGTSSVWTGRCGVFDGIDYAHRPWLPLSGWPIHGGDIAPYFDRAGQILGLGPALYDDRAWEVLRQHSVEPRWDPDLLLPVVWQYSRGDSGREQTARAQDMGGAHLQALHHVGAPQAVHVGRAAHPMLEHSANIDVLLHANATEILTCENASNVRGVAIATLNGRRAVVHARHVVLACGGIDNARLLLASQSINPNGVGNGRDMVGRFLTDHPLFEVASFEGNGSKVFRRQLGHRWLDCGPRRQVYRKGIRLSPDLQRREELLNCAVHILEYSDKLAPISVAGRALRSFRQGEIGMSFMTDTASALRRPDQLVSGAYERYFLRRPSLQPAHRIGINCVVEQQLDQESRITLSQQRDALGQRRTKIDWRASDVEFQTARRMTEVTLSEMARLGYERPTVAAWLKDGLAAFRSQVRDFAHPMCSTRMSSDPSTGVVDADCQVHGVKGLFVAGSSVFCTPGYTNPTLMITSLSLRLADHLKPLVAKSVAPSLSSKTHMTTTDRTRIGIVGAGDRVTRIYLPILHALKKDFEVVGFVGRSPERAKVFADRSGYRLFENARALNHAKPDFLLVAVSAGSIDRELPGLLDIGIPMLLETPFCWSARHGRKALARIVRKGLTVGVAEQTPYLPTEQLKQQLIDLGLLGSIVAVKNDFAVYDYHGIAALRAYLGQGKSALYVNAVEADLPNTDSGAREKWLQGSVIYDNGSLLLHGYSSQYFDSAFRAPKSMRVYGTAGCIVGDSVTFKLADEQATQKDIRRGLTEGHLTSLVVDTPIGPVRWSNPFPGAGLTDEQIAVASVLTDMASAVRFGGVPTYTAKRALQDMEILEAMRRSASRSGRPVKMPLRPTYEAIRTLTSALVRRATRQ